MTDTNTLDKLIARKEAIIVRATAELESLRQIRAAYQHLPADPRQGTLPLPKPRK